MAERASAAQAPLEDDASLEPTTLLEPAPAAPELPQEATELAEAQEELAGELVRWEEDAIRSHLTAIGGGAHELYVTRHRRKWGEGEAQTAWLMTQQDLDRIAPCLTRILNRYDPARRAAAASDPIALAIGTGAWAWRSVLQANAAARRAQEQAGTHESAGYVSVQEGTGGADAIDPSTIRMQHP